MRHLIHRFAVATVALSAALAASSSAFAGAIAHWTFDDPVGDRKIFQDTVGNGHPATPEKPDAVSAYPGDAPFGKSAALNGTYFNIPAIPLMSKGSFTVSVWFNLTKGDVPNPILADWPKGEIAYYLGTDITSKDKKPFLTADLRSGTQTTDSKGQKRYQPVARSAQKTTVPLNEWHHVAWVWEKKDAQHGTLTTYLDGNVVDTATAAPNGFTTDIRANNKNIRIGGRADSTATFNGALDELWVFNEVLSPDQIKNLMTTNSTIGGGSMAKVLIKKTTPATPAPAVAVAAAPAPKSDPKPTPAATPRNDTPAPTPAVAAAPATPSPAPAAETPSTPATPATPTTPAPTVVAAADPAPDVDPGLVVEIPAAVSPATPGALALANTHAFTPLRITGIITTSSFAALIAVYLIWAVGERSKMHNSR